MSMQVSSPTGQAYTVADDNTVYDSNNVAIGHVDASTGHYVANDGSSVALADLASQGYVFADGYELAPTGWAGDVGAPAVLPAVSGGEHVAGGVVSEAQAALLERMANVVAFTQLAEDPATTTLDARAFLREHIEVAPNGLADASATSQIIADVIATNAALARAVEEMGNAHLVPHSRPLSDVLSELAPAYRLIAECAYIDICSGGGNVEYLRSLRNFAGGQVFSDPDFPSVANERGYGIGYSTTTDIDQGALGAIRRADSMDGVLELGPDQIVGHVGGPTDGHIGILNLPDGVTTLMYVTPKEWSAEKNQIFQRAYQMILDNNTNYTQTIALNFATRGLTSEGVTGADLAQFMADRGFTLPPNGTAELSALLSSTALFSYDDPDAVDSPGLFQRAGRATVSDRYEPGPGEPELGFAGEARWYTREVGCSPAVAQAIAIANKYPTWDEYVAAFSSAETPPLSEEEIARVDNFSPNDILIMGATGGEIVYSHVEHYERGLELGDNTQFWIDSYDDYAARTEQRAPEDAIVDWLGRAGGFSYFALSLIVDRSGSSDPMRPDATVGHGLGDAREWRARTTSQALAQAGVQVSPETLLALFALMESPELTSTNPVRSTG